MDKKIPRSLMSRPLSLTRPVKMCDACKRDALMAEMEKINATWLTIKSPALTTIETNPERRLTTYGNAVWAAGAKKARSNCPGGAASTSAIVKMGFNDHLRAYAANAARAGHNHKRA